MFGAAAFEVPALFCAGRWDEGVGNNAESAIKRTRRIARSWRLEGPQVGHCKAQLKPQGKDARGVCLARLHLKLWRFSVPKDGMEEREIMQKSNKMTSMIVRPR